MSVSPVPKTEYFIHEVIHAYCYQYFLLVNMLICDLNGEFIVLQVSAICAQMSQRLIIEFIV